MCASQLAIQGAGHLAAALVEGFCRAGITNLSLYNRTKKRAAALARAFPASEVFEDQRAFDSEACPLLLAIPGPALLLGLKARVDDLGRSGRVVVSCVNGLPLPILDERFPGLPWAKAIPNVAAAVGKSVTLVAPGATLGEDRLCEVQSLFERVGAVVRVRSDEQMDRLAVVTACLPGLLAAALDEFARSYGLDDEQTRELLLAAALGSLSLAQRHASGLSGLASAVANPGGLTEVGVSMIRNDLPDALTRLRAALEQKQAQRRRRYLE